MNRFFSIFLAITLTCGGILICPAQQSKIKNVIVMIPDGTSTSLLSASRWYQWYLDSTCTHLNIDPLLCGLVKTYSSNAPIGDSAPTTSCYMTGQPSQTSFVSTYPPQSKQDLVPLDTTQAYRPLATALEGARILKHKAVGLVFTCEFPHATPADCAAHSSRRGDYLNIASQMVYNKLDVVIGGGTNYLYPKLMQHLIDENYALFLNDKAGMKNTTASKFWALFSPTSMPYALERPDSIATLAEMTQKAIQTLSQHKNGFFMMVENNQVDWAAHSNDPKTLITEFLNFDQAVKVAVDYAKSNQETVVIIRSEE